MASSLERWRVRPEAGLAATRRGAGRPLSVVRPPLALMVCCFVRSDELGNMNRTCVRVDCGGGTVTVRADVAKIGIHASCMDSLARQAPSPTTGSRFSARVEAS